LIGVVQQLQELVRQGLGIPGRDEEPGVAVGDDLGDPVDGRGHDRQLREHGFREDDPERLPQGGEAEDVERREDVGNVAAPAREAHGVLEAELADERAQLLLEGPVADDEELRRGARRTDEGRGAQEVLEAFLRLEPAQRSDDRAGGVEVQLAAHAVSSALLGVSQLGRVVDHVDLLGRHDARVHAVLLHGPGHGDVARGHVVQCLLDPAEERLPRGRLERARRVDLDDVDPGGDAGECGGDPPDEAGDRTRGAHDVVAFATHEPEQLPHAPEVHERVELAREAQVEHAGPGALEVVVQRVAPPERDRDVELVAGDVASELVGLLPGAAGAAREDEQDLGLAARVLGVRDHAPPTRG